MHFPFHVRQWLSLIAAALLICLSIRGRSGAISPDPLNLTPEEKAWIQKNPQITLGVNVEVQPRGIIKKDEVHCSSLTELEGIPVCLSEG